MTQIVSKIAHLSDFHCGWKWWPSHYSKVLAEHLVRQVAGHQPDLVICTGDLVNGPFGLFGHIEAQRLLIMLLQECNATKKCPVLLIPGNHDSAIFGIFGFRGLSGLLESSIRHIQGLHLVTRNPYVDENLGIVVFGFDSNPPVFFHLTKGFTWARGEVTDRDTKAFAGRVSDLRRAHDERFDHWFKIAAIHHHPMPIPFSGSDARMVLDNAGSLMVALANHGLDLVLHGHKHYSAFSRAILHCDGREYQIAVLAAGSATKIKDHEPKGNSYNLITIWNDGLVTSMPYFVQQGGIFTRAQEEPIICQSIPVATEKIFQRALLQSNWLVEELECNVKVKRFGDADYQFVFRNCTVTADKTSRSLEIDRGSDYGYFRDCRMVRLAGGLAAASVETVPATPDTETRLEWSRVLCRVDFGREVTSLSKPVSFRLELPLIAAFAMDSEEQAQRPHAHTRGMEGVAFSIAYPTEKLSINVEVEESLNSSEELEFELAVLSSAGQRLTRLERVASQDFRCRGRRAELVVKKPRVGCSYQVAWRLPPGQMDASIDSTGLATVLRRELLRNRGLKSARKTQFRGLLEQIRNAFRLEYRSPDPNEELDVSIMVFDDSSNALLIVTSLFAEDSPIWDFKLPAGFGIAGRVMKTNRFSAYFRRVKDTEASAIYIGTGDPLAQKFELFPHEILMAAPIHLGGVSRSHQVGVLNIGTNSPASPVYKALADTKVESALEDWFFQRNALLVQDLSVLLLGQRVSTA